MKKKSPAPPPPPASSSRPRAGRVGRGRPADQTLEDFVANLSVANLDDSVKIQTRRASLAAADYPRADGVLQIVAERETPAPHKTMLDAVQKRREKNKPKKSGKPNAIPSPTVATLENGATVSRLVWPKDSGVFEKLAALRAALIPLLDANPENLSVDIRPPGDDIARRALFAAMVGAAKMPGAKGAAPKLTLAGGDPGDAKIFAEANIHARRLAFLPPNILHPAAFARHAARCAKQNNLAIRVWDSRKLAKLKAGAFLAVTRASPESAFLIRIRHAPKNARRKIALVGKGVCFDTGGVNVKPARHMRGMGADMCGAAATLAAVVGAAKMNLPVAVDGWLALAENSIGPESYRPDEVATAANGKRIEIVHTDAEGRMMLADALTFASREKPEALVTFATLTGTMCVALGERMSGFFTDDDAWRARALDAAAETGERLAWFPAPDDYAEALKSEVADLKQCGEDGTADHIMAVLFLREFIEGKIPWTHLDLSAATLKEGLGAAPGPMTGFGAAWALALLRGLG